MWQDVMIMVLITYQNFILGVCKKESELLSDWRCNEA